MTLFPDENVEDYPRPPVVEAVPHHITIRLEGALVAETSRALRVLETFHAPTYYLPPANIHAVLRPSTRSSFCEWKGQARYFDVIIGKTIATNAAWSYDTPAIEYSALAGYLAFYAGLMDEIRVGHLRVIPQQGDFYGGWVTPNLQGRIKGAPGTRHW
jgi:uncharacterized protein (DUF427 family)